MRKTTVFKYMYLEVLAWYFVSPLYIAAVLYLPNDEIKDVIVSLLAALSTTAVVLCVCAFVHKKSNSYKLILKFGGITSAVALLLTFCFSDSIAAAAFAGVLVQAGALAIGVRRALKIWKSNAWVGSIVFLSITPMLVGVTKNGPDGINAIFVGICILSITGVTYFVILVSLAKERGSVLNAGKNFAVLVAESGLPIIVVDGDRVYYANRAALNLYGFKTLLSALESSPSNWIPEDLKESARSVFFDCLTYKKKVHQVKGLGIIRNGRVVELSISMFPVKWRKGSFMCDAMQVVIHNGYEFENPEDYI